jgi:hypothetical protein
MQAQHCKLWSRRTGPQLARVTLASTTATKLLPNDTVPGECNPPPPPPPPPPDPPPRTHVKRVVNNVALGEHSLPLPPPIHDTAQTPEDDPIWICGNKHNDEHDKHALAFVITNRSKEAAVAAATPPPHLPPPNSVLQTLLATLPVCCVIIATTRLVYMNAYQLTLSFVNLPNPSQTTRAAVRDPHPGLTRSLSLPLEQARGLSERDQTCRRQGQAGRMDCKQDRTGQPI